MDKTPDLIISGLRRQILKQDEQIQHNALYFLNKLKSNENQHKRDMDVMLFSFNKHALRIKDLEKQIEKRVVLGFGKYLFYIFKKKGNAGWSVRCIYICNSCQPPCISLFFENSNVLISLRKRETESVCRCYIYTYPIQMDSFSLFFKNNN